MKDRMGSRQTYKNIFMNISAFLVQFVMSFYVSPMIVREIGTSAYGFIGLANDFVSYAAIISSVFNSVAARFITKAFYEEDYEKANKYFNSLIVTNVVLASIMALVSMVLVPNLDSLISIPSEIMFDVKLTFALTFFSYIVTLLTIVFTTSTYVSNRTDMQGIRNIIQYIIRFALIIVFLNFISVKIYWISFATLIATIVVAIINVRLTKVLTPEIHFDLRKAERKYAFTLAKSGCWMALTSISTILLRGLDLTIANVLMGEYDMGILSISRTFPNNITAIIGTIAPIFTPVFIALYAKRKEIDLDKKIKDSINIIAVIMFVPITGFIIYSKDFYTLWQSSLKPEEIALITTLSTITVIQAYFNSTTSTLAQLSVVANKLKAPVFVSLLCGVVSVLMDILLIRFTPLGIYAIALSPTIVMIVRYVVFNAFYGAYCINKPKTYYIATVAKTWCAIPILFIVMFFVHKFIPVSSWLTLILSAMVSGVLGYLIMAVLYQRKIIIKVISKFTKKK